MNAPLSVGIPTEIKSDERRVALTPDGVRELDSHGVRVLVQAGAGEGASIPDEAYKAAGAEVVADAAETWARAERTAQRLRPSKKALGSLLRANALHPHRAPAPTARPHGGYLGSDILGWLMGYKTAT